ncbi:MAG TPA: hypothetical protein ENJ91_10690 [Rhodobacteraceae bacterium]|nr:hypothetical protein [Paracoccaceae bacterium]
MRFELNVAALQEDLRKIGVAFIIGAMVALMLDERITIVNAIAIDALGIAIWLAGLIRKLPGETGHE